MKPRRHDTPLIAAKNLLRRCGIEHGAEPSMIVTIAAAFLISHSLRSPQYHDQLLQHLGLEIAENDMGYKILTPRPHHQPATTGAPS